MMGLWPRRAMMGLTYRNHLVSMDENGLHETSDGEEFHPPFEHHGQPPHQQFIFPSASQASGLTQTLSFAAGDVEAHTPSVFADSRHLQVADEEERKPAARRAVFAASNSFESSHSEHPSPDPGQESLAASMHHHPVDFHQHSSFSNSFPGFGQYAPPASPNQEPDLYSHSDLGSLVVDPRHGNYAPPPLRDARLHQQTDDYLTPEIRGVRVHQQVDEYAPQEIRGARIHRPDDDYAPRAIRSGRIHRQNGRHDIANMRSSWGPGTRDPWEDEQHSYALANEGGNTKRKTKTSGHKKSPGHKKKKSFKHPRPKVQASISTPRRSPRVKSRINLSPVRSTATPDTAQSSGRGALFRDATVPGTVARFEPSDYEISQCQNNRKLTALENFYSRMNDLAVYHSIHGHCNVPQQYEENKQLGVWVNKTRMEKKKFEQGKRSSLTKERIDLLDQIGFYWGTNKGDAKWEEHFSALLEYSDEQGHCNVPTKYPKHPALGRFVSTQRCEYKKLMRGEASLIDASKVERLEKIGFCWDMVHSA